MVNTAKNFAKTICVSDIGNVKRTSIVLMRFSSERILMVKDGTKIKNSQGNMLKKGLIDADPTTKMSLTKRKFAKTANKTITI